MLEVAMTSTATLTSLRRFWQDNICSSFRGVDYGSRSKPGLLLNSTNLLHHSLDLRHLVNEVIVINTEQFDQRSDTSVCEVRNQHLVLPWRIIISVNMIPDLSSPDCPISRSGDTFNLTNCPGVGGKFVDNFLEHDDVSDLDL